MASNSSDPGGLGSTQTQHEWVEVNEEVPIPPGAGVEELVGTFRLILGMGYVQRVEFQHGKNTASVTRLVRDDMYVPPEGPGEPHPLAEGEEFSLNLDLYALVRSGEVALEEFDSGYDVEPLTVIRNVAKQLEGKSLYPCYVLAGDRENFLKWLDLPPTYKEDRVRGMPVEYNVNIPEESFLVFAGPEEGCQKDQLQMAVRVVFRPAKEVTHEQQADRGDGPQGPGPAGDAGGAGEQGQPAIQSAPPPFLGPSAG